jgi:serine/threonine protein kinase
MDHPTNPTTDQTADDASVLPPVDEVVERLKRLWESSPPASISGESICGLHFGRYELEQIRGQGAFGVVYLAVDTRLNRHVALKVPRAQVLADVEKRGRFEAEASAAAMLDHPGIITVYEAELTGPTPYIASAYCPGPDLGEWLAGEHAPVSWSDAAAFVAKLADAVEYAHNRGVYHRDLKPSNVLLMPTGDGPHFAHGHAQAAEPSVDTAGDGAPQRGEMGTVPLASPLSQLADYQPKLTDFGLAKLTQLTVAETRSSLLLGTPLYMAPEQLESSRGVPPAAADVYSLGCLVYELVAGRPPIEGDSYVQMLDRLREQSPIPLRRVNPAVPRDLERVVAKCLEKNPLARYQTAAELATDLRACVDGTSIQGRDAGLVSRFKYWCTRPQRIRDAGWYMLCVQTLLIIWLTVVSLGANLVIDLPLVALGRIVAELCVFVFVIHLPMALVGWFTTRRHRWAIHAGFYLTLINLIAPAAFFLLPNPPLYADIYSRIEASKYVAFTTCSLVLIAELGQVLLYAAAIVAWRRLPQNQTRKS